jgi:uncharacterized membrane protein
MPVKIPNFATATLLCGALIAAYLLDDNRRVLINNAGIYHHIADVGISILMWVLAILWFAVAWVEASKKIYGTVFPHITHTKDSGVGAISDAVAALIVGGAMLIFLLLRYDFAKHRDADPAAPIGEYLGTVGDFFGGVLNPILTFCTLIAVVLTVVMQRMQLRDTKIEADENARLARLQTFETTFFNLINLHVNTVQDLRVKPEQIASTLLAVYKSGNPNARPTNPVSVTHAHEVMGRAVFSEVIYLIQLAPPHGRLDPKKAYSVIQKQHNHVLGKYFRNLYQILEFIDDFSGRYIADPLTPNLTPGKRYADILRAQLSSDELVLIFYNCLGRMVDNGQFREKLKKYELLEHMSIDYFEKNIVVPNFRGDISVDIQEYFYYTEGRLESPGAFGKNASVEDYLIDKLDYMPVHRNAVVA